MARVKGPLMSMEARGNTTGGKLQFRTTPTGTHVYQPMDPSTQNQSPPTPGQEAQRLKFKAACGAWGALSNNDKALWCLRGIAAGKSGFAEYISEYLRHNGEL